MGLLMVMEFTWSSDHCFGLQAKQKFRTTGLFGVSKGVPPRNQQWHLEVVIGMNDIFFTKYRDNTENLSMESVVL